jgi:hypothetical protein
MNQLFLSLGPAAENTGLAPQELHTGRTMRSFSVTELFGVRQFKARSFSVTQS